MVVMREDVSDGGDIRPCLVGEPIETSNVFLKDVVEYDGLAALSNTELRSKAQELGASQEQLDAALDSRNFKDSVIAIIKSLQFGAD